jgi:hypothetical protein
MAAVLVQAAYYSAETVAYLLLNIINATAMALV